MTDSGYSDDGAYDEDRAGGTGAGGLSGGPGYADDTAMSGGRGDSAAMSGGRGGYAGDEPGSAGGVVDDRAGYPGDTGVAGGSAGYADDAAMGGRGSGVGSRGADGNGFGGNGVAGNEAGPLLASAEAEGFRARWTDVQTGFVDEPRRAVEQADGLTAELMQHLAKTFADERLQLERQWDRGEDIHTDDLRTAFQRYRSFFERLLST